MCELDRSKDCLGAALYSTERSWWIALCPRLPACYDTRISKRNGARIVQPSVCTELQNNKQLLRVRESFQAMTDLGKVRVKLSQALQTIKIDMTMAGKKIQYNTQTVLLFVSDMHKPLKSKAFTGQLRGHLIMSVKNNQRWFSFLGIKMLIACQKGVSFPAVFIYFHHAVALVPH